MKIVEKFSANKFHNNYIFSAALWNNISAMMKRKMPATIYVLFNRVLVYINENKR